MGLAPAGDSGTYFQTVPLLRPASRNRPSLTVAATLRYPADYVVAPIVDDTLIRVTGEVVSRDTASSRPHATGTTTRTPMSGGRSCSSCRVIPTRPSSTGSLAGPGTRCAKGGCGARHGAAALLVVQSEGRGGVPWSAVEPLTTERISLAAPTQAVAFWGWLADSAATALVGWWKAGSRSSSAPRPPGATSNRSRSACTWSGVRVAIRPDPDPERGGEATGSRVAGGGSHRGRRPLRSPGYRLAGQWRLDLQRRRG